MRVGTGPEALHAEMTSGNSATIRSVCADIGDAMRQVRESIELVRYAQDRPEWDSDDARRTYNMRAWATRASAEVCFNRLNRSMLATEMAADGYDRMERTADEELREYRRAKQHVADALTMWLLVYVSTNNLLVHRADYTSTLDAARDFLATDPFSTQDKDWQELGLVKSMLRDLEHGTMPGPVIPETLLGAQDDRGWTPQGLGYDPATGALLQTAYEEVVNPDGSTSYLSTLTIIDPDTGEVLNTVELGGGRGAPPDHAGGVFVHDGTAWVASSSDPTQVVPYSLSDLGNASPTDVVQPSDSPTTVAASAATTVSGDTMYVASHNKSGEGVLYAYTWDPATKTWTDEQGPFPAPEKVQGIAVRGNEIVFSTSRGRENGSTLQSYNLGDVIGGGSLPDPLRTVALPNMSEGTVMTPEGILTTYESGSSVYSDPLDHDPSELWASTFVTITPYDELGLAGGVQVVPATLQSASGWFVEAEQSLDRAERRVGRLNLPPSCLGRAPGTAALVTEVDTHLDTTATWIGESRISSDVTASGLIAAANDYEEADARSDNLFGWLQRFVS